MIKENYTIMKYFRSILFSFMLFSNLFVYANKKPLKLNIKPYYKDFMFNGFSKMKPYDINYKNIDDKITYVDLENVEF